MKKQVKRVLTLAAALGMSLGLTISAQAAWVKDGDSWLYDMGSGRYATGWHYIDNDWYYFNRNGNMQTGWRVIDGEWYYLRSSGAMAHNQWVGNYYLRSNGAMAHDRWIGDYYVGSSGEMLRETWIGPYWVGKDGKWIPGYTGNDTYEDNEDMLIELDAFYCDYGKSKRVDVALMDKLGNSYINCIEYEGGTPAGGLGGNISTFDKRDIYVLDGEYSTFEATIFVPETRSSYWDTHISETNKKKGSFTLRIYGDDIMLYQSPLMTTKQYPVDVELDISGVDQLAFSWATFGDVTAEIGLANAMLYKD